MFCLAFVVAAYRKDWNSYEIFWKRKCEKKDVTWTLPHRFKRIKHHRITCPHVTHSFLFHPEWGYFAWTETSSETTPEMNCSYFKVWSNRWLKVSGIRLIKWVISPFRGGCVCSHIVVCGVFDTVGMPVTASGWVWAGTVTLGTWKSFKCLRRCPLYGGKQTENNLTSRFLVW